MLRCDFHFQYANFDLHAQIDMQTQLLGISGPSGSGKSTFLKNIVRTITAQRGLYSIE